MADKLCTKCRAVKPHEDFVRHKSAKDGLVQWRKACFRESSRRYREQNPERARESSKLSHRRIREQYPERYAQEKATRRNRQINLKARLAAAASCLRRAAREPTGYALRSDPTDRRVARDA